MLRSPMDPARRTRRGMVTAQVAMSMGVLMAVLALLFDGGMLLVERRHAQATADAAALAAATDLYVNWNPTNQGSDPNGTANNSALGVASANGYTNDGTTSTVTVNIFPANYSGGPNAGQALPAGYAEVTVTYYQQRGFSGVFGSGAIPISARAVAGVLQAPAVLLLDSSGNELSASNNASLTVNVTGNTSGGAVVADSTAANAISAIGNATLTAPQFAIAGNDTTSQNGTITTNPTANNIQTNASQVPNPLSSLPTPSATGTTFNLAPITTNMTLSPGVYVGGITIAPTGAVTLQPGTYYMQGGGFSVKGTGTVINDVTAGGSGVMIYNDGGGAISMSGNSTVKLTPWTTGPYAGITLFQNPTSASQISITGNGSSTSISGAIYGASANLNIAGNGGQIGSQIIVSTLTLKGNGAATVNYNSTSLAAASARVTLVQ
jgi:Flp pilus assembly protein TadG